uniref:Uncharacterized protein n=1 Tax=Opuntia streptacantha TaxID=393608 RepID=A0A7C8YK53_OPUST
MGVGKLITRVIIKLEKFIDPIEAKGGFGGEIKQVSDIKGNIRGRGSINIPFDWHVTMGLNLILWGSRSNRDRDRHSDRGGWKFYALGRNSVVNLLAQMRIPVVLYLIVRSSWESPCNQ